MRLKRNPQQEGFAPENPGCLHKRIVYSQKPQIIQNNLNPDGSPEYLLHYDSKILQQSEGAPQMGIINRSLLALACLQQGRRDEALAIGETAYHEALEEGGVVIPLCEMILGMILLEKGDAKEAGEKLKNSAALLMKLARQIAPGDNSQGKVRPINLDGRGGNRAISGKQEKKSGMEKEDDSCLFRIQMFGPFRVFYRDEEIHASSWRTVKSRDLLAYLAHKAKPVSTDQILEDLWPDLDPDKASAVFHTTLYYLRRLIQKYTKEEIIIHGSRRYQLRPGSALIDRYQFEEIAQRNLGKTITETGADELETAAVLYQGDYLEDFDYEWVVQDQEQLRNLNINLRHELAGYYLKNQMYSRALVHIKQIMAEDPYSEEGLRLLLAAHAGKGDLLAVRQEYVAFAKNLFEDLGTRPSFEIAAFYKALCSVKTAVMHA